MEPPQSDAIGASKAERRGARRAEGKRMLRKGIEALVFALAVSVAASASVGGLEIYDTGNVLLGAGYNDGPGSSDMTLILRLQSSAGIYAQT